MATSYGRLQGGLVAEDHRRRQWKSNEWVEPWFALLKFASLCLPAANYVYTHVAACTHTSVKAVAGAGGKIITANAATFPAVVGNGAAMAVGLLEPCGMNTPHTHPRATEIQFSVNGTIRTGMITENGARFIMTEIGPGGMTIFPQGSVHFQLNEGCEPAMFVSGFNSEDPGALQIAQRFLGLSPDIVAATLGDIGVEEVLGLDSIIPDSVSLGTDECLKRCNLPRTKQPTTQRQPRVSGNAFPSGVATSVLPLASKF
ncbi:RmlC-like cupin [Mycena metata]|uniref:RmlC-like cupin n=1 Tax=Mycena metata TaxID=1033252 RepID=A0AAD7JQW6_9AGAR|nr:RmlC-like cupin [Mycena metata]